MNPQDLWPSVQTDRGRLYSKLPAAQPANYSYLLCLRCKRTYPPDANYCEACNADLDQRQIVSRFAPTSEARRHHRHAFVWLSVALLLLALGVVVMLFIAFGVLPYLFVAAFVSPFFFLAAKANRNARRSEMRTAEAALELDRRTPVLFLRSFHRDGASAFKATGLLRRWATLGLNASTTLTTFEELLVNELYVVGPVVAVNDPGERGQTPDVGALRLNLGAESWSDKVRDLCRTAQLVALMLDETPGLKIELEFATHADNLSKLLLVLPPISSAAQQRSYYPTYLYLAEKYPVLPTFDAALVAIAFDHVTLAAQPLLAPHDLPNGEVRALVVACWLNERTLV